MQKNPSNLQEKVALLPSSGIGDGLLMMGVDYLFQEKQKLTSLFHPKLNELAPWFPNTSFLLPCMEYELSYALQEYAWIFVQNDNSTRVKELFRARELGTLPHLSIFYVTHNEKKHGAFHPQDYLCDLSKTILDNLLLAANRLLGSNDFSKKTDLFIPNNLQKSRFSNRIVLHPTSGSENKNWPKEKYLLLAKKLQDIGFEPAICVSLKERSSWTEALSLGLDLPFFSTLHDFACFLYESKALIGNDSFAGHLSSLFSLPTFLVASKKKQMQLWQPGWEKAHLIFPPSWIPNWKGFRLLERRWQHFVSVDQVFNIICKSLTDKN
jgi:heptosyltransferase III